MKSHPKTDLRESGPAGPGKRMGARLRLSLLTLLATMLVWPNSGRADHDGDDFDLGSRDFDGDLINLIPSLYGGDGIFLQPSDIFDHSAHFTADSLAEFNRLSLSVREIDFPRLNTQVGERFTYDSVLDEFVRQESASVSSLFAEDADTIGKGSVQFGFVYSRQKFSEFEGQPLDEITVDLRHIDLGNDGDAFPCLGGPPGACHAFERDVVRLNIDINLREEHFTFVGAYGLTDRLDMGIIIPIVRTTLSVGSLASVIPDESAVNVPFTIHEFGDESSPPFSELEGKSTGLGDIFLRTKYWALKSTETQPIDVSIGMDLRLPTGDENNFRGLAKVGVRPLVIASTTFDLGSGQLRPHINLGYEVNSGSNQEHEIDYAVGAAYGFGFRDGKSSVSFSADFLGTNVVRRRDGPGDDQYDVSLGVKVGIIGSVQVFYNAIVPLNDEGLRPSVLHSAGFKVVF